MPFEAAHWIITGILGAGFIGALVVLWRHRCKCLHDRLSDHSNSHHW